MGLDADVGDGPVALDTAAFIYFIEDHPTLSEELHAVFQRAAQGRGEILTSEITLLEVLVHPLRHADLALAARYEAFLTRSLGVRMLAIDRDQLRQAAALRAAHPPLKTPDALQLSAALSTRCSAFVTNDRRLPPIPGLKVLKLSDYA